MSVHGPVIIGQTSCDLLVHAAQGATAFSMIRTAAAVKFDPTVRDVDRAVAQQVLYDAITLFAYARERLIDYGANFEAEMAALFARLAVDGGLP